MEWLSSFWFCGSRISMDFLITSGNSTSGNELKRRCVRTPETSVPLLDSCSSGIASDEHCSNIQADGGGLKLQLRRIHRLNSWTMHRVHPAPVFKKCGEVVPRLSPSKAVYHFGTRVLSQECASQDNP